MEEQVQRPPETPVAYLARSSAPRWALAALLVLAVASFFLLGLHRYLSWESVRGHFDALQATAREHLGLALGMYFFCYVAVTGLSLPFATVLTLLGGALFGLWLGTAVVSVASTLGATLAFLASRFLFRDWVQRRFANRLRRINQGVEQDGAWYLLMLRLVVAVPFFLINLGMGLTPMRTTTFLLVSWLGMLPATFLYVSVGRGLGELESPRGVLSWEVLVPLALLGIVPVVLRRAFWRSRAREEEKENR